MVNTKSSSSNSRSQKNVQLASRISKLWTQEVSEKDVKTQGNIDRRHLTLKLEVERTSGAAVFFYSVRVLELEER